MQSIVKQIVMGLFGGVFCLFIQTAPASAASLSFQSANTDWPTQGTQVVEVAISSTGEVVNAIQGTISYPSDLVDILAISHGGSTFTLWPDEPKFDPEAGLITFSAGLPNGSYVDAGEVFTLLVQAKQQGSVQFTFIPNQTAVYLNDGFATPAVLTFEEPIYQVVTALHDGLIVTSTSHPEEHRWYPATTFMAQWPKKAGASYSFQMVQQPNQAVDDLPDETIELDAYGQYSIKDLSDGVHYFMVKEKVSEEAGWSEPVVRTVMVDSTPPLQFSTIRQQTAEEFDGSPFLVFSTTDNTSGVDHYVVTESGSSTTVVNGPFKLIHPTVAGIITIQAVDKAGNSAVSTIENTTTEVVSSRPWLFITIVAIFAATIALIAVISRLVWRHRHS